MTNQVFATTLPSLATREERTFYLSQSPVDELCSLIDELLHTDDLYASITVVKPATTGSVVLHIREPVVEERFILGDAIVTTAEVLVGNTLGWSMIPGTEPRAAIASAIADALLESTEDAHRMCQEQVFELISRTKSSLEAQREIERTQLESTIISFEELD